MGRERGIWMQRANHCVFLVPSAFSKCITTHRTCTVPQLLAEMLSAISVGLLYRQCSFWMLNLCMHSDSKQHQDIKILKILREMDLAVCLISSYLSAHDWLLSTFIHKVNTLSPWLLQPKLQPKPTSFIQSLSDSPDSPVFPLMVKNVWTRTW